MNDFFYWSLLLQSILTLTQHLKPKVGAYVRIQ